MPSFQSPSWIWKLFRFSFVTLPYFYYAVFPGLIAVIGLLYTKFRRSALDLTTRNLLLIITGLLWLSCLFAANRGEAFLQLFNFLPYMLLFSVLPYLLGSLERLAQLATEVVIATLPINLLASLEYVLKADGIPDWLKQSPLANWYRSRPHADRAMVMFGHPNALASYLVMVLGLGLGLILYYLWQHSGKPNLTRSPQHISKFTLVIIATFSCLLGIFASGSRNGLIVAVVQLLIFSLFTKTSRFLWATGLVGLLGILLGAAWLGIGGRSLHIESWSNDPRVGVWKFALGLLEQHPLLGWGLGNFKLQYPPGLIPDYQYIAHPHNFWLLLAVEAGMPLLILFTLFVGRICFQAVQQFRKQANAEVKAGRTAILLAYLLAFGGCLGFALFDVTFYDARINVINWVMLAGLYTLTQKATWQ
jgi:O-antigen ligase